MAFSRLVTSPAGPGMLLVVAALMAVAADNSPFAGLYDGLLAQKLTVAIGSSGISKPLLLWINDGLMAIFFLYVGLEIKKEFTTGRLSSLKAASLPLVAAVGGMVIPALLYVAFNTGDPVALRGWAIPAATDIAFALGLLALFAARAPAGLKVFLLALAVFDDLGVIVIIALFFTESLSILALSLSLAAIGALVVLNLRGVKRLDVYCVVGLVLWTAVLKSGVHATLAGVALGLAIPVTDGIAERFEHMLKPWVNFFILPLFAFANAGISFSGFTMDQLTSGIAVGTAAGLAIGKPLGILGLVWLAVRFGPLHLPPQTSWKQIGGVACLAGVGFTMSLFIGTLAFDSFYATQSVRIGVILGSVISAVAGLLILNRALPLRAEADGFQEN